ncbi:hypothetical protein L1987_73613 [Smallanthus sonchifolius]|uniref:Uncharacterized protein n=1 Tax=Smallanthus sonchifolius TaxID=185202 RepID=A0ACB9A1K4_9ASTR|nr:hypothetical protein L1987_73613 [Smallanthus sonchifolius]
MNSIFSSFDALSAEFLGKSVNYFTSKSPAPAAAADYSLVDQKKVKHETDGNAARRRSKAECSARWAPEFDRLHCFESMGFEASVFVNKDMLQNTTFGCKLVATAEDDRLVAKYAVLVKKRMEIENRLVQKLGR